MSSDGGRETSGDGRRETSGDGGRGVSGDGGRETSGDGGRGVSGDGGRETSGDSGSGDDWRRKSRPFGKDSRGYKSPGNRNAFLFCHFALEFLGSLCVYMCV